MYLLAKALVVTNDESDYEINDQQPDAVHDVAIGWRLVRVNGKAVSDQKSIKAAFGTKRAPFHAIFIKVR